ncbi:MAG: cytochrome C assembly family protein [Verrucomicrobiota bacterium]
MLLNEKLWMALGAIAYLVAFGLALGALWNGRRYAKGTMAGLLGGGWVLQFIGLHLRGLERHACPLGNPFEVIQFVAWSAVLIYLLVFSVYRLNLLGLFVAGLVGGLTAVSLLVPGWDSGYAGPLFGGNPWIELHASLAIFSYGIFGVLAGTSLMFLLQQYGLEKRQSKPLFHFLPSITELDSINRRLLLGGLLVLSTALLVGSIHWVPSPESITISKLGATIGLWLAYLLNYLLRLRGSLTPKRFAIYNLALFIVALLVLWPVERSRPAEPEPPTLSANPAS